jgi:hypothetical protein
VVLMIPKFTFFLERNYVCLSFTLGDDACNQNNILCVCRMPDGLDEHYVNLSSIVFHLFDGILLDVQLLILLRFTSDTFRNDK